MLEQACLTDIETWFSSSPVCNYPQPSFNLTTFRKALRTKSLHSSSPVGETRYKKQLFRITKKLEELIKREIAYTKFISVSILNTFVKAIEKLSSIFGYSAKVSQDYSEAQMISALKDIINNHKNHWVNNNKSIFTIPLIPKITKEIQKKAEIQYGTPRVLINTFVLYACPLFKDFYLLPPRRINYEDSPLIGLFDNVCSIQKILEQLGPFFLPGLSPFRIPLIVTNDARISRYLVAAYNIFTEPALHSQIIIHTHLLNLSQEEQTAIIFILLTNLTKELSEIKNQSSSPLRQIFSSYFRPKSFEKDGRLYEKLGIKRFKKYVLLSGMANADRFIRSEETLKELLRFTKEREIAYLLGFVTLTAITILTPIIMPTIYFSVICSVFTTTTNVIFYLYPLMLQRYNRIKIYRILGRAQNKVKVILQDKIVFYAPFAKRFKEKNSRHNWIYSQDWDKFHLTSCKNKLESGPFKRCIALITWDRKNNLHGFLHIVPTLIIKDYALEIIQHITATMESWGAKRDNIETALILGPDFPQEIAENLIKVLAKNTNLTFENLSKDTFGIRNSKQIERLSIQKDYISINLANPKRTIVLSIDKLRHYVSSPLTADESVGDIQKIMAVCVRKDVSSPMDQEFKDYAEMFRYISYYSGPRAEKYRKQLRILSEKELKNIEAQLQIIFNSGDSDKIIEAFNAILFINQRLLHNLITKVSIKNKDFLEGLKTLYSEYKSYEIKTKILSVYLRLGKLKIISEKEINQIIEEILPYSQEWRLLKRIKDVKLSLKKEGKPALSFDSLPREEILREYIKTKRGFPLNRLSEEKFIELAAELLELVRRELKISFEA
ncbi:MAG: hypothetical protein NC820_07510, partial [Candidatus Omnitrophica bacterium]|nr:hypothetical protein [Candidatus Omnitrophota bacterium]